MTATGFSRLQEELKHLKSFERPNVIKQIAEARAGIKIVKINIDDNITHAAKIGVMTVPTLALFKDGKQIDKIAGAFPKRGIEKWLDENLED